jgi:hypothetical protein
MEMTGQIEAPVASLLRKDPMVPFVREDGWTPQLTWTLWGQKRIFCLCRESKPNFAVV